jgi:alkaline phosphatase
MRKVSLLLVFLISVGSIGAAPKPAAKPAAKNVVLFLADAGGLPVIAAASLHAHGAPNKLFMQRQMPFVGLSDTSTASQIVSDSAAGMTAIVTGQRTHNGVIAQSAAAVRGKQDGETLKTILEYAEEHGLSTGVISNDSLTGATPASTYAHVNDRGMTAEIFHQAFTPKFGDGVDVMIGSGRAGITKALTAAGTSLDAIAAQQKRPILSTLDEVPADATRTIVLLDNQEFDVEAAVRTAHRILSKNKKGYFLMVEVDTHTDRLRRGIEHMVLMDKVIEKTASLVGKDTLLMLTADHSFDMQLRGGRLDAPLLEGLDEAEAKAQAEKTQGQKNPTLRTASLRMENSHTGEPVIVAAKGPGAERVRGFMLNTDLFSVMMDAYGWKPSAPAVAPVRPRATTNQ